MKPIQRKHSLDFVVKGLLRSHFIFFLLSSIHAGQAAPITWRAPENTTNAGQLIEGKPIFALNGGGHRVIKVQSPDARIFEEIEFLPGNYDSLAFNPYVDPRFYTGNWQASETLNDQSLQEVLMSFTWSSATDSIEQRVFGLTTGKSYLVQLFFNDQRDGLSDRTVIFGDGESPENTATINARGSGWGQHVIGEFTADDLTQTITHFAPGGDLHFSAMIVTEVLNGPITQDYADWVSAHHHLSYARAVTDDPDGDDLPNVVEAVLGTDPTKKNTGLSVISARSGSFSFEHPLTQIDLINFETHYEWSSDLINYYRHAEVSPQGTSVRFSEEGSSQNSNTKTIQGTLSGPNPSSIFVRLAVSAEYDPTRKTRELIANMEAASPNEQVFAPLQREAFLPTLFALDYLEAGKLDEARAMINPVVAKYPASSENWRFIGYPKGVFPGTWPGYASYRMMNQILQLNDPKGKEKMKVGICYVQNGVVDQVYDEASNRRKVQKMLDPLVRVNDFEVVERGLRTISHWMRAVSGGHDIEFTPYMIDQEIDIFFHPPPGYSFYGPTYWQIFDQPGGPIADDLDLAIVVYPDGNHPTTEIGQGGATVHGRLRIIFVSDLWLLRRQSNQLARNPDRIRSEMGQRTFITRWFQHEFMHLVYGVTKEYELEKYGHQWQMGRRGPGEPKPSFWPREWPDDYNPWPDDFLGRWEEDYYHESFDKRLLNISPTLLERFRNPN